jgi:hypothetical protein
MQSVFTTEYLRVHHCPRCGTLRGEANGHVEFSVPKVIERGRSWFATARRNSKSVVVDKIQGLALHQVMDQILAARRDLLECLFPPDQRPP